MTTENKKHIEVIEKMMFAMANYKVDGIKIMPTLYAAKAALERQIPQKLVKKNPVCYDKTKDGEERYAYDYHCPVCDTKLKLTEHHCLCGQALDWSDTE